MTDPTIPDTDAFRSQVLKALGDVPDVGPPDPPTSVGESCVDGIMLKEYQYTNGFGETVGLTVAEPVQRSWPNPVMAIHQTNDCGRKEVFGLDGDQELEFGLSLAKRGHRVFAIDLFLTGDRSPDRHWDNAPFYEKYPKWSMMGKMLADMKDLEHVIRNEFREQEKIHYIGHSVGGLIGYFLAALGNSVSRAVCNACYFQSPPQGDAWQAQLYTARVLNNQLRGFCVAQYMDLLVSLAAVNCDLLLTCYSDDKIIHFPVPCDEELKRIGSYSQRCRTIILPGPHAFPRQVREASFEFLETLAFNLPESDIS